MKCTAWAADDLFEKCETMLTVLAKIAVGHLDYGDAEKLAQEFFDKSNEQPYCYYDPDDEDEEHSSVNDQSSATCGAQPTLNHE